MEGEPRDTDFRDADSVLSLWYDRYYSSVAVTANGSWLQRYLHRQMERPFGAADHFPQVLEVGGNRGEHLRFVRHRYDRYVLSDIRSPEPDEHAAADPRVETCTCDVASMPFRDGEFDRLISTCLLHHVASPLSALQEMRRCVRPGGVLTVLLPTDPGLFYRAARRITSGRGARRRGVGELHELVTALDHRNHFPSLLSQISYVFRRDDLRVSWYPWRFPSWNANAFAVVQVRLTRAEAPRR